MGSIWLPNLLEPIPRMFVIKPVTGGVLTLEWDVKKAFMGVIIR